MSTLEAKIKEYEATGKDITKLSEQLAARDKEREALQAELRALKHESSPEFKKQYEKPFNDAAEETRDLITQLTTVEAMGDNGEIVTARPATWDDFVSIFTLPYGAAYGQAKKVFGEHAGIVMQQYVSLQSLKRTKDRALQEERTNFKQREEQEAARRTGEIEVIKSTVHKVRQEVIEAGGESYAPDPKDQEEASIATEADTLFDAKPATLQQRIVKDAHLRAKVRGYYLAQHRLGKAQARIKELESAVAALKGNGPGPGRRPTGSDGAPQSGWREELRKELT
jgi:uncharacterized coiled-coil protein SlyX